jgi:LacI family transcriptional regulator
MSQESTNHVTLSSVAQFAGVSTTTVSRVLNNKGEISDQTRQKVFDAIKALGYRPSLVAQGLRTKASRLIGLMMPEILSPLFTEIAMGVEIEASLAGFTVVQSYTLYSPEREKSGVHYLLDRYVDGVVFYSPVLQEDELIPLLNQIDTSVVINHPVLNPAIGELNVDNLQGMRLAIRHLVEQGCQKIAYFSPSTSSWNGREREAATIKTLQEVGLPFDRHLILNFERDASQADQQSLYLKNLSIPESAIERGEWAARCFLDTLPDLDAIIGFNDLCAIGIIRELVSAGKKIPEEIAVVGFDNSVAGKKYMPSLTSLGITMVDIGRQAARMLIDNLEKHTPLSKYSLDFEIFPRQSTMRIKK